MSEIILKSPNGKNPNGKESAKKIAEVQGLDVESVYMDSKTREYKAKPKKIDAPAIHLTPDASTDSLQDTKDRYQEVGVEKLTRAEIEAEIRAEYDDKLNNFMADVNGKMQNMSNVAPMNPGNNAQTEALIKMLSHFNGEQDKEAAHNISKKISAHNAIFQKEFMKYGTVAQVIVSLKTNSKKEVADERVMTFEVKDQNGQIVFGAGNVPLVEDYYLVTLNGQRFIQKIRTRQKGQTSKMNSIAVLQNVPFPIAAIIAETNPQRIVCSKTGKVIDTSNQIGLNEGGNGHHHNFGNVGSDIERSSITYN